MDGGVTLLVSTAYLPPVDYVWACREYGVVVVDSGERYEKQSYRNRCEIGNSQGRLPLVVPVIRPEGHLGAVSTVRVDYATAWQRNHLGALRSAYGRTAYFAHYFPELSTLLLQRSDTLLELNVKLLQFLLRAFEIDTSVRVENFGRSRIPHSYQDLRKAYHPKRERASWGMYYQAFGDRLQFMPNLSALDLLFNEGPHGGQFHGEKM